LSAKLGQRIQWRRDKVREYSSRGYTVRDIADVLKVSKSIIDLDLQLLRQEAKQNIQHYVDEYLSTEFQYCLDALNLIVKEMWALKQEVNRGLMQSRLEMMMTVALANNVIDRTGALTMLTCQTFQLLGTPLHFSS
jgi:hypothetical protein